MLASLLIAILIRPYRSAYFTVAFLICFGLLVSSTPVHAQADPEMLPPFAPSTPLRFERLSLEQGLSQNSVLAMLQDRQGFLWIATQDGLNRFDGYSFAVYKHDPEDSNTLSHNSILSLLEDEDGMLWVGTWGGGLNRLDPQREQVTRYRFDTADGVGPGTESITTIRKGRDGLLWIGTIENGLIAFDRSSGEFEQFRHNPADENSLSSDAVSALYEDGEGFLWVGTGGFGAPGSGLNRFDPETKRFTRYTSIPDDLKTLSSDTISSILPAEEGKLWVGTGGFSTSGGGLSLFDPLTGEVTRFQHDEDDPMSLASDDVVSLFRDRNGQIWVGTWGGGLDRLERQDDRVQFTHHRYDPFLATSISADIVWSVMEDRTGVLWLGTINGGLNKVNPQVQRFGLYRNHPDKVDSLGFDVIGAFHEDKSGGLWIGTWGGGLDYFDRNTDKFAHFRHDASDPESLADDSVSAIYADAAGLVWVGTAGGLDRLDRGTGTFTHYRHDPADDTSLANDGVSRIVPAGDGRLWIGTLDGLDLFDPVSGRFVHFRHHSDDPTSLPDDQITELQRSSSGTLWIGTWHGGLAYLDPDAWAANAVRFVRYQHDPSNPTSLADNGVWAVHEDARGMVWVGTQRGLDRLDPDTGDFVHLQEKDGLPNSTVICIQEDTSGVLWLGTNGGLSRLNPILMRFRNFDVTHGLQSNEFDSGACLRSRNGELYFGGVNGFNVFRSGEIHENGMAPPVVVTTFRIFNRPVPVDLSGATPIELSFRENFIAFDFAALDYHAPGKNRYAYRLEGFDETWVEAADRRYASYTNLPGGEYTFRVRGSNNDGVWNEAGVLIPLRVWPPFWETWWFRGASVVLMLGLVAGSYFWRVSQVRTQNRRLEQRVVEQTAALRHEMEQRRQVEAALAQKAAEEAVIAERTRLARDLHDAVTQTLFSASLIAEILPDLWASDVEEGRASTEELRQLTRGALAEMRTLLLELRPSAVTQTKLDDLVRQLIDAIVGRTRLPVEYTVEGQRDLPVDVKVMCYRIAQEALNNIVKYARAKQVIVDLRQQPSGVRLSISDDGAGFDPDAVGPGHLGQRIMRERADSIGARLTIQSEIGHGTVVMVTWLDPEFDAAKGGADE